MKLTLEQAVGQKVMLGFDVAELPPALLATLGRQRVGGVERQATASQQGPQLAAGELTGPVGDVVDHPAGRLR